MLKKYFFSIIVSIILAFTGTNLLNNNATEKWELTNTYSHILNDYDVDFTVLTEGLTYNSEYNFTKFINQLDNKVARQIKQNDCAGARGDKVSPSVLVTLDNVKQLKVVIYNEDKGLILKCEKFIDEEIENFEKFTNKFLKKIISINNPFSDNTINNYNFSYDEEKIKDLLSLKIKELLDNSDENNKDIDLDSMKELEQAIKLAILINQNSINKENVAEGKMKSSEKGIGVNQFDIIRKETRSLVLDKQDNKTTGVSIFFITQLIFIVIIILSSRYIKAKQKTIRKKINQFLR
jgi:hypothetical protein